MKKITKPQRGMTLMESVLALAILGSLMSGLAWSTNQYVGNIKKESAAKYMAKWMAAADQYLKDNSATLAAAATATVPATVTTAQLIAANLLPTGTQATNPYGQTVCAKVLEPSANVLTALVVTNGGTTINDIDAGDIAAKIGPNGGAMKAATPTTASGAYGGWSVLTTNYKDCSGAATTAGHLAGMLFLNATQVEDYLYRNAVPGHPEANTMSTALNMGGQNITAAADVAGVSATLTGNATVGGTLGVTGASALAGVTNSGTLTQTGNATMAGTLNVAGLTTMAGGGSVTGAAGLAMNTRNITGVGTLTATTGNITTVNATNVTATGTVAAANVTASSRVTMAEGNITGTATSGAACTPNGLIRKDATTGKLLSCQSLVWTEAAGGGNSGWKFQITGYTPKYFLGTGTYIGGKFSGSLMCDPATSGVWCGNQATIWCAADALCSYGGAFTNKNIVLVADLPVVVVTQLW